MTGVVTQAARLPVESVIERLESADATTEDRLEAARLLRDLADESAGPADFPTWKAAALHERSARMREKGLSLRPAASENESDAFDKWSLSRDAWDKSHDVPMLTVLICSICGNDREKFHRACEMMRAAFFAGVSVAALPATDDIEKVARAINPVAWGFLDRCAAENPDHPAAPITRAHELANAKRAIEAMFGWSSIQKG